MATLARLLGRLDRDDHIRGREFERICRWYLENDPVYKSQIRRAWFWKSWPGRWGADAGIDLVAELRDGSFMAVQAKAYAEHHWVTKADVDSFLSESSRTGTQTCLAQRLHSKRAIRWRSCSAAPEGRSRGA